VQSTEVARRRIYLAIGTAKDRTGLSCRPVTGKVGKSLPTVFGQRNAIPAPNDVAAPGKKKDMLEITAAHGQSRVTVHDEALLSAAKREFVPEVHRMPI
jgi:hypothetical protein